MPHKDINLDELRGGKGKTAITVKPSLAAQAGKKIPGPFVERLPANIIHASDLTKPQLLFHDAPDNARTSESWKPSLTTKPHAMVPLGFKAPLDYELTSEEEMDPSKAALRREKEIRARTHPYYYETKHLPYPTSLFIDSKPVPPQSFDETPFEFVDTPEKFHRMVGKLKQAKEIAVDLEHHDMRSYSGFTCLIQISTRENDWVVDTLSLRKEIQQDKFGDVFTDPTVVKVFHGADSDIVWLQRDFEIFVVNLFDTYNACVVLGMPQRSLSALLQHYCNFEADKRYQRADWRIRPLPDGMLNYARSDTHFLLFIYDNLRNALLHKSSRPSSPAASGTIVLDSAKPNPQEAMREVLDKSAETALKMYERDSYDIETGRGSGGWLAAGKKWLPKGEIEQESGWVWRHLHDWRDRMAREMDESPFYVMPNNMLRDVSTADNTANLSRIIRRDRAPIAAQYIPEITSIIVAAKKKFKEIRTERATNPQVQEMEKIEAKEIGANDVKKVALAVPAVPSVPLASTASNIWNVAVKPTSTRANAKSGLFGTTIKSSPLKHASGYATTPNSGQSALFGVTLNQTNNQKSASAALTLRERELSPGFLKVMESMRMDLHPRGMASGSSEGTVEKGLSPETVPFIPSNQRKTTATPSLEARGKKSFGLTTESSHLLLPGQKASSPAAFASDMSSQKSSKFGTVDEGVVQVKKSKKQKKRERATTADGAGDDSDSKKAKLNADGDEGFGAATPPDQAVITTAVEPSNTVNVGKRGDVKKSTTFKKKTKVKPQDIPAFDYANQPNLLDQPQSSAMAQVDTKKKKKKVKEARPSGAGIVEVPTFGARPARDLSQPKQGNKSGTFAK
ncbi:exosome complex exonuclease RRP6 [Cryptococcus gattii NT-10]|nr:exosome complex exonuclease RRP6 [Cryptococcus gattii NT-10]